MATLTKGQTFGASETITNTKLHNLVDLGAVSNIVNADIDSAAAIVDTKLAQITTLNKVSGSAIGNLASIPSGAGVIPAANIPSSTGVYFQAGAASGQTISHNVDTKLVLPTEDFDSHGYFDNATNYRFTPGTAGKYVITSRILGSAHDTTNQYWTLRIKKNGSTNVSINSIQPRGAGASDEWSVITSTIVSFNGTTDYVETYVQQTNTGTASKTLGAGSLYVCFFGYKIGD